MLILCKEKLFFLSLLLSKYVRFGRRLQISNNSDRDYKLELKHAGHKPGTLAAAGAIL
jgi:hypothetical protein